MNHGVGIFSIWLVLLFAGTSMGACTSDGDKPAQGEERGACFPNDTCNQGLICLSGLCVRPPELDAAILVDALDISDAAVAPPAVQPPVDPNGANTQYIIDRLVLPDTDSLAQLHGLNIDGDVLGSTDNALGAMLAQIAIRPGAPDIKANLQDEVLRGKIVLLATMKATSTSDATGAGLWLFLGDTNAVTPTACTNSLDINTCGKHLNGSGTFAVGSQVPTDGLLTGPVVSRSFIGGPGTVSVELALVAPGAIRFNLIGARVKIGTVTSDGLMTGTLGGAVTSDELYNSVLPAMAAALQVAVAEDCIGVQTGTCPGVDCKPCGCADGSTGSWTIDLFDDNNSCRIDRGDLRNGSFLSSYLVPDLDLLDADGKFYPRLDGVKDSFSVGIGFRAVKATFINPTSVDAAQ